MLVHGHVRLRIAAVALAVVAAITSPAAAWAHGEGETDEGYLLVQQALAHLAHDTTTEGIDLAMEKVQDTLDTDHQEGVDVAMVKQGMKALEAGDAATARTLLQRSIKEATGALPAATGDETGTTVVSPELPGRSGMHGEDWLFLALSVGVGLLGLWLAIRYRPADSVRSLRTRLTAGARTTGPRPGGQGGR